jgi:ribonuclease J
MNNSLTILPLGGIGNVTKNMYVYEHNNEILIVDCGLGFADESMLGVDLLLPDISYLLETKKTIVGMVLTHGHEDHIGALPFVLPQLPANFPIFATPLTAAFANNKIKEFGIGPRVKTVRFEDGPKQMGSFSAEFIRVTHSVPDTSHIFIKTPAGNVYHGSDFKFDDSPYDGKTSDYAKIERLASQGVMCLLSDCLGSERDGHVLSEQTLSDHFEKELASATGKFIVTTYSSNISRLNQVIDIAKKYKRKVCFIGRSLVKAKDAAKELGYMKIESGWEVALEDVGRYADHELLLLVAGSQGQENSAMSRMANDEHKDIHLTKDDVVVFSSDPIPGNEISVYELVDTLARREIKTLYSPATHNFHVSGHGASEELEKLITLVKPKWFLPIGGNYRHMYAYRNIVQKLGHKKDSVILADDGQKILISQQEATFGEQIHIKNVLVDEVSGEEVEHYVLRDRQKLSEGGIAIVLAEIDSSNGQLIGKPDVIVRGFTTDEGKRINNKLFDDLKKVLGTRKGKVTNWIHIRKLVGEIAEKRIFKDLRRRPLVLPVVIET